MDQSLKSPGQSALDDAFHAMFELSRTAPAVGALAAGNRVMIKPSELVPRFSALLKEVVAAKFDATEIVVTGIDDDIAKTFASLPFDHPTFTGSTRVGRLVAEAAGPAIVDRSADLGEAAAYLLCKTARRRTDPHRPTMRRYRKVRCPILPTACRPIC
jgi:hypothetical protein